MYLDDYYGYNTYNYSQTPFYARTIDNPAIAMQQNQINNKFIYPENFPGAIELIQQALSGETEDRMFYSWLIANAPAEEDVQIISGIRDDEIGHYELFRQIYYEITGVMPQGQNEPFTQPESYCAGLANALLGEQNAVRKYRNILYAMQDRVHINILTEIITDEIRHGILYNYLYSKNGCRG